MTDTSLFSRLLGQRAAPDPRRSAAFPHLCAPTDGYLFVISYGLAGDVLVQDLLNAVPGVVIRGENGNLLQSVANAWFHAEASVLRAFATHEPDAAERLEDLTLLGWHLADTFARDVLAVPATCRMSGFREIRQHGDAASFKRQLDFMAAFFPNARFIFETRDVVKVAQTGWWREQDAAEVQQTLAEADALFEHYLSADPYRSLRMHYDAYAEKPMEVSAMYEWLGLPEPDNAVTTELIAKHRALLEAEMA